MRAFGIWLVASALCWIGAERLLDSHYGDNPQLIVVALDTSVAMEPAWTKIPALVRDLNDATYSQFVLHGPRGLLHGASDKIDLGQLRPYGPRSFDYLASIGAEGHRRILITNAPPAQLPALSGWEVLSP